MNKDHGLLVERYRPIKLNNYVGNENIKKIINQYLEVNDIQNFILYGPAGTGKTTLAKLIVKNLNCDFKYINASDERGIDTIREKVAGFAAVASFKPLKVVILDEADFLTIQAQASLRNTIEKFSKTTRFILTCNYIERIIDPLQSRCQTLKIIPPSKKDVAKHLAWILNEEKITYSNDDIKIIVNNCYPDLRRCLNTIQLNTIKEKDESHPINPMLTLKLDKSVLVSSNYMTDILKELIKPKSKSQFNTIRQIVANSGVNDFDELFKYLYDKAEKYLPGKEGMVAYYINEHSYQANFRIDKEINCMSLINQLINLK